MCRVYRQETVKRGAAADASGVGLVVQKSSGARVVYEGDIAHESPGAAPPASYPLPDLSLR